MATPLNASLLKGFDVLRLFAPDRPEIAASTVQSELGLNAATAHRFLATLEEAGAVVPVRRGWYRLGYALSDLGRLAEQTNPIVPAVRPLLDGLGQRLAESVMVCRLGRAGPTCVVVAEAERPITVSIRVGTSLSLLRSAQGRIWLAELSRSEREKLVAGLDEPGAAASLAALGKELDLVRCQGFALNRGDVEADIGAVAVPVRTPRGRLVYTLSAFGPLSRITHEFATRATPLLQDSAAVIGRLF